MHPALSVLPPSSPRVAELAVECLEDIGGVIDDWLEAVRPVRAHYADDVPDDDFRTTARQAFELLLRTVADLPVPDELAAVSERIGERRARQGVPMDSLLAAARLDFRVVWAALVARADDGDKVLLVASAYHVWEAVERHVTGIMTGYQRTVLEMGRQREDERRLWCARLLETGGHNPTVVRDAGLALGFRQGAEFLCAAALPEAGAALRDAATALRTAGAAVQQQTVSTDALLVVELGRRTAPDAVLDRLAGIPCGVSPAVSGLASVPRAAELATATAHALPEGTARPCRLEDSWLDVLVHRADSFGRHLADDVLAGLFAPGVPEAESARLLETVRVHLAGSGSIADTAEALYCHRNTVQHRFTRFSALTGRDIRRPGDATLVTLALRVHDRHGERA